MVLNVLFFVQYLLFLPLVWFLVIYVWGTFKGKPPVIKEDKKYRYAVLVCAHNEVKVIGHLLDTLIAQEYPKDKYQIIVIADHCNDGTELVCKEKGVMCYERHTAKGSSSKGAALAWGIEKLQEDFPDSFDMISVFDADNLVDPKFVHYTNEAFCTGADLVMGNRQSSNAFSSVISGVYSLYWNMLTYLTSIPRNRLGMPGMITGTGFSFKISALPDGKWSTETLTEDMEFYISQVLNGKMSIIAEKAVFFDEQPETLDMCISQLRRWMTGLYQINDIYLKKAVIQFGQKPSPIILDSLLILATPICIWLSCIIAMIVNIITVITNPLMWGVCLLTQGVIYLGYTYFAAIVPLLIMKKSLKKHAKNILLFPILPIIMTAICFISVMFPQTKWKKVVHTNRKSLKEINKEIG